MNEQEEKAKRDEIREMEKRIADRIELQRHQELQKQLKIEKQIAEAEEEEAYRR